MIVKVTIRNFKGISEIVELPLKAFHVMVGPNGVGKTTFLDAIDFVRDCLTKGPAEAVASRGITDFNDLTWMRKGGSVDIELFLDLSGLWPEMADSLLSYHLVIRQDSKLGICVADEALKRLPRTALQQGKSGSQKPKRLLGKTANGTDFYAREKGSYQDSFTFGLDKLTLALTPPDDERYFTANAVRRFLTQGVRYIQLDSPAMRHPCPTTRNSELDLDGSNLARVVGKLLGVGPKAKRKWAKSGTAVSRWVEHLRYALPDIENIGWSRRQADNAEYVQIKYRNGLEAPSWILSDGTLRMLALTLPAFLPVEPAIYMVEEPENGVHPKALEIILRSLSAIPGSQLLLATHSPLVVQQCGIETLLCFSRDADGSHVTPGPEHAILREWDGFPDIGTVFAAGVLE